MTPELALAPGILMLASAAAPIPGWLVPAIGVGGTVLAGIVSAVTTLVVKRMSQPVDAASVGKARAETVAVEVAALREVIGTLQVQQDRDRDRSERVELKHQQELVAMQDRLDAVIIGLKRHQSWDRKAATALRRSDPDFPAPPPLGVE